MQCIRTVQPSDSGQLNRKRLTPGTGAKTQQTTLRKKWRTGSDMFHRITFAWKKEIGKRLSFVFSRRAGCLSYCFIHRLVGSIGCYLSGVSCRSGASDKWLYFFRLAKIYLRLKTTAVAIRQSSTNLFDTERNPRLCDLLGVAKIERGVSAKKQRRVGHRKNEKNGGSGV